MSRGNSYDPLKFTLINGKSDLLTSIFKGGERSELVNVRPILLLPYFTKILKRIIVLYIIAFTNTC